MDDLADKREPETAGVGVEQGPDPGIAAHATNQQVTSSTSKLSLPSSRSFEQQRAVAEHSKGCGAQPEPSQHKGRLGPVKSLESASGPSGGDPEQLAPQSQDVGHSGGNTTAQSKQLFGLRQLALPSARTLTGGTSKRHEDNPSSTGPPTSSTQVHAAGGRPTSSKRPIGVPFKLRVQNSFAQPQASGGSVARAAGKSRAVASSGVQTGQTGTGARRDKNHNYLASFNTSSDSYSFEQNSNSSSSYSSDSQDDDDDDFTSEDDQEESCTSESGDNSDQVGRGKLKSVAGEDGDGDDQIENQRRQKGRSPTSGKMRKPESAGATTTTEPRAARRRRSRARRTSCCQCEPIINRIDFDCQPVTDVDLVTYKHLCQLEQKQQQLRAHQRRGGRRVSPGGAPAGGSHSLASSDDMSATANCARFAASYRHNLQAALAHGPTCAPVAPTQQNQPKGGGGGSRQSGVSVVVSSQQQLKRRSSLQEESGAYYQLCTTPEEQAIRAKYVWFPPSLRSVALVDQFFSYFPKDKIPYNLSAACCPPPVATATPQASKPTVTCAKSAPQDNTVKSPAQVTSTTQQVAVSGPPPPGNNSQVEEQSTQVSNGPGGAGAQPQPASSLACASYRDEQISFQLPRQDISLDYCSYHMSEPSRASYLQFVDKRNSQSLDVGSVIQIKLATGETKTQQQQQARKQSSASQVIVVGAANPSDLALAANVPADRALASQRCRRCLVRFEDQQLVVVAPNFAIGTPGPYHAGHAHAADKAAGTLEVLLASSGGGNSAAVPRRNSVSIQQAPAVPTLDENFATSGNTMTQQQQQQQKRALTTTAKQHLAMFHPNCFTCATCKEFLVDLVYCLREGKLYCLRHYGESLRPRCSWCQEVSLV